MFYKVIKRIFDFICALIGIIGTSPLWIVGIIGILISDWGPVFYTARRIGKNNKPFKMYKFRSMRVAKATTEASLRPDEDRIFPFGHFIRKVKIDELPQLLNILNGTMSIIGPRPVAQDQFDMFRYGKWNEAVGSEASADLIPHFLRQSDLYVFLPQQSTHLLQQSFSVSKFSVRLPPRILCLQSSSALSHPVIQQFIRRKNSRLIKAFFIFKRSDTIGLNKV